MLDNYLPDGNIREQAGKNWVAPGCCYSKQDLSHKEKTVQSEPLRENKMGKFRNSETRTSGSYLDSRSGWQQRRHRIIRLPDIVSGK